MQCPMAFGVFICLVSLRIYHSVKGTRWRCEPPWETAAKCRLGTYYLLNTVKIRKAVRYVGCRRGEKVQQVASDNRQRGCERWTFDSRFVLPAARTTC